MLNLDIYCQWQIRNHISWISRCFLPSRVVTDWTLPYCGIGTCALFKCVMLLLGLGYSQVLPEGQAEGMHFEMCLQHIQDWALAWEAEKHRGPKLSLELSSKALPSHDVYPSVERLQFCLNHSGSLKHVRHYTVFKTQNCPSQTVLNKADQLQWREEFLLPGDEGATVTREDSTLLLWKYPCSAAKSSLTATFTHFTKNNSRNKTKFQWVDRIELTQLNSTDVYSRNDFIFYIQTAI